MALTEQWPSLVSPFRPSFLPPPPPPSLLSPFSPAPMGGAHGGGGRLGRCDGWLPELAGAATARQDACAREGRL
eukprot:4601413-Prymnesium_polylepis.1